MLDNINPSLWGKHIWKSLEYICLSYPSNPSPSDAQNIKTFIISLSDVLPCSSCRNHFKQNLSYYPLSDNVLSGKLQLLEWLNKTHNMVNKHLGKPYVSLNQMLANIANSDNKSYITQIILIVFIVLGIIYMKS
jgi:hypothetical protein